MRELAIRAFTCAVLLVVCAPVRAQSTDTAARTPRTADAADVATGARIKAHVAFLADDLLEGREAGTRGHEIAARYIAAQFALAGAKPGGVGGSYLHPIELHETARTGTPPQLILKTAGGTRTLIHGEDALISGARDGGTVTVEAPLVFVGYGMQDSRVGIDDYAGLDVRGKIAVMLVGVPRGMDSEIAAHLGAEARGAVARHGAIGSIAIHTPAVSRAYPWEVVRTVLRDEQPTTWVTKDGQPFSDSEHEGPHALVRPEAVAALFEGTSHQLIDILAATESAAGRPKGFALPGTASITLTTKVRRYTTPAVVAMIEGRDPVLRSEYVVLTAHADHIGVSSSGDGDRINNGALDNAMGTAMLLEVARTLAVDAARPKRSVLLIAHTAEEKGMLGASALAHALPVPQDRVVASINLDMPVLLHDFSDVISFGGSHSTMEDAVAKAASSMALVLSPDPMPEEAIFVRSDHYALVKAGVPSVMLAPGIANDREGTMGKFLANHYHRPSDDLSLPIDWKASGRFARLNLAIVKTIGDADAPARWYEGDYFGETFAPGVQKAPKPSRGGPR